MKKKIYMLIMCMLTVSVLFGCGNDETQEQQADQGTYFKIVDEINNGNYETAFSDIEKNYGNVDYKDPSDGMNKMLLYRLYYDTQEMFDDEMGVLLDYLKAVDFKAILAEDGISQEKENIKTVIKSANKIIDNHLAIMSKAKTAEERHFYMTLCIKESYSARELDRQINSGYYERYMLSKEKLLPEQIKGLKENPFLDSYVIEFLDLPKNFKEADLRKGLIQNMKEFILEVGKDFTFIDEEYRVQVGGEDFRIDLLFFHRGLQCLVAFELKIGKFKPEYISKMDFYLEALDRQKKKENENPSVGMILCASKDDEVVEYAMSRTLSPMMVAEYKLQLPDKAVLQKKLQELINMPLIEE